MINTDPASFDRNIAASTQVAREKLRQALDLIEALTPVPAPRVRGTGTSEKQVRALLAARRKRDKFFPADLFADPAWDILLELYAAELGQRRMPVSALCIGAAVPPTTALRWIGTMEKQELLSREPDPFDGRRFFIRLTESAILALEAYFASLPEHPARV